MQTYDKANAEKFANEAETILRNFKGSPLTAETLFYMQRELDDLLLEWKTKMGFLPEIKGDCGNGRLKRLIIVQDGRDSVRVDYKVDEDAEFVRKRNVVVQEIFDKGIC